MFLVHEVAGGELAACGDEEEAIKEQAGVCRRREDSIPLKAGERRNRIHPASPAGRGGAGRPDTRRRYKEDDGQERREGSAASSLQIAA